MSRKSTRQLVPLKQEAGDTADEDYGILCPSGDDRPAGYRVAIIVLSLFHIFLALASMLLGVAAVCTAVSGFYIGYGIWCGFIFLLTGIITWISCYHSYTTNGMITTSLVFNILAACAAAVQFSLAIIAATNDRLGRNERLTDSTLVGIDRYNIYYSELPDWFPCSADFDWPTWAAVDILLVIVAGVEACIAIFAAALACRSICFGRLNTAPVQDPNDSALYLGNNDYPVDGFGGSTLAYVNPAYAR